MTEVAGASTGLSGARLERVVDDLGRTMVLKLLPPGGDWLTRLTGGQGRLRRLWESGVLGRVANYVDHAIEAVDTVPEGGDVVVMRDVGDRLLPPGSAVPVRQAVRLFAGLAELHHGLEGWRADGLCPMEARFRLFDPAVHAADPGPVPHPFRDVIVGGWDAFGDLVRADVAEAVFAVHRRPETLAAALTASAPATLLHGDPKLENLGLDGTRLVAIDWGELTGVGPAEADVTWLAIQDPFRFDVLPDVLFAAYDDHAARRLDRRTLDLACIGALAQFGFRLAARFRSGDDATRARAADLLDWWVTRVRDALWWWSPVTPTGEPAR